MSRDLVVTGGGGMGGSPRSYLFSTNFVMPGRSGSIELTA